MKLCAVIRGWKNKMEFVGGQNPIMPSPILSPIFTNLNAFSLGWSKHCSIDAYWPIMVLIPHMMPLCSH